MNARSPPTVRSVLFWAIVAVQIVIPVIQLGETRPARFGWQMFSGVQPRHVFVAEFADGTTDTVVVADHLARKRPEMDLAASLPPALCRRIEGAERIHLRRGAATEATTEFDCP